MYKLIIADDEAKIRKRIRNMIPWQDLNIEVVGEAEDGENALELAREQRPQIILADVCMPFVNGLDFIEKIKEEIEEALVIVISGHDEFVFMQKAIKLKVFDYLLKPINREDFKKVIEKAVEELNNNAIKHSKSKWEKRKIQDNLLLLRENFLINVVKGSLSYSEIEESQKFLQVTLLDYDHMVIIRPKRYLYDDLLHKGWDGELIGFALINIIIEVCKSVQNTIFSDGEGNVILLCCIKNISQLEQYVIAIKEEILKYLKYEVIIVKGEISFSINGIKECYEKLLPSLEEFMNLKPFVFRIKSFIESNYYHGDLTVEKVAEELGATSSYVTRLLKSETGFSFIDYLTKVRIEKAMELMKDPKLKIYEISQMVGYNSQHYFSRAFKKVIGCSPLNYKEGAKVEQR